MSDIVERLRELEGQTDAFAKNQHHSFVTTQQMARESAAACHEAATTIERLTKERDHYLSNWKEARRYLTIETGHAEDAEARADSLAAELAKVREALKPFARWLDGLEPEFGDHDEDVICGGIGEHTVTFGDLRRARAALPATHEPPDA